MQCWDYVSFSVWGTLTCQAFLMTRGFQRGRLQSSPLITMAQCHFSVLKGPWGHRILALLCLYSISWWGLQLLPTLEILQIFGSNDAHIPFICILSLGPHTCRYNNNTHLTFVCPQVWALRSQFPRWFHKKQPAERREEPSRKKDFFFPWPYFPIFFFILILSFHSRLVKGFTDFCCLETHSPKLYGTHVLNNAVESGALRIQQCSCLQGASQFQ